MHIPLRRLHRNFGRGRKQFADFDLEAEIGKGRSNDLLASVMAILANFRNQDSRPPALSAVKLGDELADSFDRARPRRLFVVHAADGPDHRSMPAERSLERGCNL